MKIKKQYEMNESAWIHLGNGKLHKGKIVDIFDLEHAGYPKSTEFYIVEVPCEIEPNLEVRTWESISQDAKGPIGAYREIKEFGTRRFLGKMGIDLPHVETATHQEPVLEHEYEDDPTDPTPEQVNAAIARAEQAQKDMYRPTLDPEAKKKRNISKGKTYAKRTRRPTL